MLKNQYIEIFIKSIKLIQLEYFMNMKILVKIKKNLIPVFYILFLFFLVLFSSTNFKAAKSGLNLWANNVIPALFPFFVAVELLKSTNLVYFISLYLDKYMRPIFNVPGIAAFPFIMGLISGYPVGAKIVSSLYSDNLCSKEEAERMLTFTNNSGPLFIIGTVGTSFYGSSSIGIILLVSHILSALSVGIIFGSISKLKTKNKFSKDSIVDSSFSEFKVEEITISNIGVVLSNSIISAVKTILIIGGFVVFFSVVISILKRCGFLLFISKCIGLAFGINYEIILGFITGLLEFTNGLNAISLVHLKNISINLTLSSFVIGFGGFSVFLQVLGIISKYKLSSKLYFKGKVLQGFLAALYTYLILYIPFFSLNI